MIQTQKNSNVIGIGEGCTLSATLLFVQGIQVQRERKLVMWITLVMGCINLLLGYTFIMYDLLDKYKTDIGYRFSEWGS